MIDRKWLDEALASAGITYSSLKTEFHFSPDTIKRWEQGYPARPYTVRKLARILGISYLDVIKNLRVTVIGGPSVEKFSN